MNRFVSKLGNVFEGKTGRFSQGWTAMVIRNGKEYRKQIGFISEEVAQEQANWLAQKKSNEDIEFKVGDVVVWRNMYMSIDLIEKDGTAILGGDDVGEIYKVALTQCERIE